MKQSRKLKQQQAVLDKAETYEQWRAAAKDYDDMSGATLWRRRDHTRLYDYIQIRKRLENLRNLRTKKDDHGLLFALNEGVHGNMGGMGNTDLYTQSLLGTKHLIEDYCTEIADAVRHLAALDQDVISFEEKYDFFHRASLCFGRSALMLSGGGSLGHFHLGVIKALMEHDLVPHVLSGSSAGSMVSAIYGTRSRAEMEDYVDVDSLVAEFSAEAGELKRMRKGSVNYSTEEVRAALERLIPNLTFQEAYDRTGCYINISVAPAELHQTSRLLNAITAPNVLVRDAVLASCAVPGVFPPVALHAKDASGKVRDYLPGRRWIDGSLSEDFPIKRLSRLYGVNHYIGSMINPILYFSNEHEPGERPDMRARFRQWNFRNISSSLRYANKLAQKYGGNSPRLKLFTNTATAVFSQDYRVDIAVYPNFEQFELRKLIQPIAGEKLLEIFQQGERAAWRRMGMIENCTKISRTLDEVLLATDNRAVKGRPHRPTLNGHLLRAASNDGT
ncbi:MAG: DUF3336 domain-containing protein [Gammaproteobacteria bacterium]|nr:DUF3336 domain-containing protein [Gammaproteobacteria bacterium]MBT8150768.1 DUF3336 domain-containing protein [Gammaproteobacteria bacterium]NND38944.1 DUF3336 domain-containing protein [Pseudomonadales bacterium]NNL11671.1 DUF3336 domain-containing protein [Pseudomonadales bacterium]NNM11947.1 DUF3336 domain-containing protein [Pseudomonadales bacterium]